MPQQFQSCPHSAIATSAIATSPITPLGAQPDLNCPGKSALGLSYSPLWECMVCCGNFPVLRLWGGGFPGPPGVLHHG